MKSSAVLAYSAPKRATNIDESNNIPGRAASRRARLELVVRREQLFAYNSILGHHMNSVELLADCAVGREGQLVVQGIVGSFEETCKAYVDCTAGASRIDEFSEKGLASPKMRHQHTLSILALKGPWLRLLTAAFLTYDIDDASQSATMASLLWPHAASPKAQEDKATDDCSATESSSDDERNGENRAFDDESALLYDTPSCSILEAIACDIEQARHWRRSLILVESAEKKMTEAPATQLTAASGERRIPPSWSSGSLAASFVRSAAQAVRVIVSNPAWERYRRNDSIRTRLALAFVNFANDGASDGTGSLFSTPELINLNDLVERFLDAGGQLPTKVCVVRRQPSELVSDEQSIAEITKDTAVLALEGFVSWSKSFADAAGVSDSERGIGVGTAAAASLMLSKVGQQHISHITVSLRVLAAHLRHREFQKLIRHNDEHTSGSDDPLPGDLMSAASHLGLCCERHDVAAAAKASERAGLFRQALRVFRAMLYIAAKQNSSSTVIAPTMAAEHAVEQMAIGENPEGPHLQHALRVAFSSWGIHKVALAFIGLPVQGTAAMRLLDSLLSGGDVVSGMRLLSNQQDIISRFSSDTSEGATLALGLQMQFRACVSWAQSHRATKRLSFAVQALGSSSTRVTRGKMNGGSSSDSEGGKSLKRKDSGFFSDSEDDSSVRRRGSGLGRSDSGLGVHKISESVGNEQPQRNRDDTDLVDETSDVRTAVRQDQTAYKLSREVYEFLTLLCSNSRPDMQRFMMCEPPLTKITTVLWPSMLEAVIAALISLVNALDPDDKHEMELVILNLELLHLLIQGNEDARNLANDAGVFQAISTLVNVVANQLVRAEVPDDDLQGTTGMFRKRRGTSAPLRSGEGESVREEHVDRKAFVQSHSCRGSALRLVLTMLTTRGGRKCVPLAMDHYPPDMFDEVMRSSIDARSLRKGTSEHAASEREGFYAYFCFVSLVTAVRLCIFADVSLAGHSDPTRRTLLPRNTRWRCKITRNSHLCRLSFTSPVCSRVDGVDTSRYRTRSVLSCFNERRRLSNDRRATRRQYFKRKSGTSRSVSRKMAVAIVRPRCVSQVLLPLILRHMAYTPLLPPLQGPPFPQVPAGT